MGSEIRQIRCINGDMKNEQLPPPTVLTAKQAKFVEGIARGMLAKDAYRAAFDTEAEDHAVRADAAKPIASKLYLFGLLSSLKRPKKSPAAETGLSSTDSIEAAAQLLKGRCF